MRPPRDLPWQSIPDRKYREYDKLTTYIAVRGRELGLLLNFGSAMLQPRSVIPPMAVQAS